MPGTNEIKRDRVQLRLDAGTKRALERAAAYERKTVTEFVLASARIAAERVIDEHEKITLPPADWERFHDALLNPPEPNAALQDAVRWFRELAT